MIKRKILKSRFGAKPLSIGHFECRQWVFAAVDTSAQLVLMKNKEVRQLQIHTE
jgi:hypothetical protein